MIDDGIRRYELEDMDASLRDRLEPRVTDVGYLGELFQIAAHQPAATLAYLGLVEILHASLPDRIVQVTALTACAVTDNGYELHQVQRSCLDRGYEPAWVAAASCRTDAPPALDETEAAVQRLAMHAARDHGHGGHAHATELAELLGESATVAVLMLVGFYLTGGIVANTLEIAPPYPSPLN